MLWHLGVPPPSIPLARLLPSPVRRHTVKDRYTSTIVLIASCDALGRVVLAPAKIPAGAITASIGGPHLVWMVLRRM
jgi:iron complex transport system permease protein